MSKRLARPAFLRGSLAVLLFAAISPFALQAQETVSKTDANAGAKITAYDVVSIRPNKSQDDGMRLEIRQNVFRATNTSLRFLISDAYGIRRDLISGGPGWVDTDHWDLEAKIVDADAAALKQLTFAERKLLLQKALADRFGLKAHVETKALPIYELVLAKDGTKLQELPPVDASQPASGKPVGGMSMGRGMFKGDGIPLSALTNALAGELQRTVLDKTGLTGKYNMELHWAPESAVATADDSTAPPLFTAVQEQLGLKLQAAKGPVDTLVIDHAERPTEN